MFCCVNDVNMYVAQWDMCHHNNRVVVFPHLPMCVYFNWLGARHCARYWCTCPSVH
jgi:hypothetical protein